MQIDRESPICGVKPVRLKALMQLDRFSTPTAMAVLKMPETKISDTLTQLGKAGWISWGGTRHDVDLWSSMPLGHRLAASRLIRRFPVSQGRALLPKIVETARRLNADPHASHRICGIILFGSVLTGEDDGDAGDIDLVVDTGRRRLPSDTIKALIAAEERAMPEHLGFHARLYRQHADLCRAIKKVSNKISLHGFGDVRAFSAVYRELYRYDVDIESETAVDAEMKLAQPDMDRPREEVRHVVPPTFTAGRGLRHRTSPLFWSRWMRSRSCWPSTYG
ncbi:MAG: nucleotidyltransferase domain-containing protein [Alphaproteobacteria bacterium]|nr:MAG: nucleotidyltransferase domain-containing protein [Alphaproteobacteria bacterium]